MLMKMLGYGLFFESNSYFTNKWNILDFFLNISILIIYLFEEYHSMNIPMIECIRFFKLMKINPIKVVLIKIASTLLLLAETFSIVLWFIIIYAIWGLQLYSGLLKNICQESSTGLKQNDTIFCGNANSLCPSGYFCSKVLSNPDFGLSNYDNLFSSCLQVFKIITGDDWINSMFIIQRTFNKYVWIYFVTLVIFGNFFMMNLILAVLKVKYGQNENVFAEINEEKHKIYDLKELKRKRIIIAKNRKAHKNEEQLPQIITESKVLELDNPKKLKQELDKEKKVLIKNFKYFY